MNIVKETPVLRQLAKKYALDFCPVHKYYDGNAYKNSKGEYLPHYFKLSNPRGGSARVFKLRYFDGCFNPFLVEVDPKTLVYSYETGEPCFVNWSPVPKWDTLKYYTV